jgi:hypothetical protein
MMCTRISNETSALSLPRRSSSVRRRLASRLSDNGELLLQNGAAQDFFLHHPTIAGIKIREF